MDTSDASQQLRFSSREKGQSLKFLKKLWKIVNECNTGEISWSTDGAAVVIDSSKFKSDYLAKRCGFFKPSSLSSFVRRLSMYGFRKISPQHTAAVGNVRHTNLHVFQNKFFIRGRPDLLPALTRKPRSRRAEKEDRGNPGPSSGRSKLGHDSVNTKRAGHNRAKAISLLQRTMPASRAQNQQLHDVQPARLGTPLSCPTGTAPKPSEMTGSGNNDVYSDSIQLCPQESTTGTRYSDTDTSNDEYDYSLYTNARKELAKAFAQSSALADGEGRAVDNVAPDVYESPAERQSRDTAALVAESTAEHRADVP